MTFLVHLSNIIAAFFSKCMIFRYVLVIFCTHIFFMLLPYFCTFSCNIYLTIFFFYFLINIFLNLVHLVIWFHCVSDLWYIINSCSALNWHSYRVSSNLAVRILSYRFLSCSFPVSSIISDSSIRWCLFNYDYLIVCLLLISGTVSSVNNR